MGPYRWKEAPEWRWWLAGFVQGGRCGQLPQCLPGCSPGHHGAGSLAASRPPASRDQHSLCRPSCTPCPPAMPHACTRHWSATFSSTTSTATPCPLPAASVCRCVPGAPSSCSRLGKRNDCRLEGWRGPRGSVADCPSFAPAEAAASLACGLCASQSHGVLRWGQRAGIALTSRGSWCSRAWRWRAGRGTLELAAG